MKLHNSISLALTGLILAGGAISCNKSGADEFFDKIDLMAAQTSKEKWGFVNKDGKTVLEDEFAERPTAVYNGLFTIEEKGGYTLYKMSGDEYKIVGECEKLKSVGYLEDGLIPMTFAKQRISVADASGNKKFDLNPVNGQEVTSCDNAYLEGLLGFTLEDGNKGYFDDKGNVAIKPIYSAIWGFSDGLAVVEQTKKDSKDEEKTVTSVIDKKGNTVFTIKEDYVLSSYAYYGGYLFGKDGDKAILIDRKGEIKKLPSKINSVIGLNGSYIIFTDEDRQYGVADLEGEIIIRAKYDAISFDGQDHFLGKRNDKIYRLDKEGKEVDNFDFDEVVYAGKFGYAAQDGNKWELIDEKGKQKGKDDYYNLFINPAPAFEVTTDYFNVTDVAKKLVSLIDGNKVGGYELGSTASKVLAAEKPDNYSYRYSSDVKLPNLNKEGFRYTITGSGLFTESLVNSDWNSSNYTYSYSWNPSSKLCAVKLTLDAATEWGEEGFKALSSELKSAGYNVKKTGYAEGDHCAAVYTKGQTAVVVDAPCHGDDCTIIICDTSEPRFSSLIDGIVKEISDTKSESSVEVAAEDSAVIELVEEEAVVVEEEEPDYY